MFKILIFFLANQRDSNAPMNEFFGYHMQKLLSSIRETDTSSDGKVVDNSQNQYIQDFRVRNVTIR